MFCYNSSPKTQFELASSDFIFLGFTLQTSVWLWLRSMNLAHCMLSALSKHWPIRDEEWDAPTNGSPACVAECKCGQFWHLSSGYLCFEYKQIFRTEMYIEPTPPLYLGTYIGPRVPLYLFRELHTASKNLAVLNIQNFLQKTTEIKSQLCF